MNNSRINNRTRRLTLLGLMVAVTFILGYTPIGFITIPPISLTIVHIPTIIAAILLGPVDGMIIGASMGIVSLMRALTAATPLDPLFVDPRVSVLPRILIGLMTYIVYFLCTKYVFKWASKKVNVMSSTFVAAIFGSLTNTAGVLGTLYFLYAEDIIEELGATVKNIVLGALTFNIVIEMLVAAIVSTPIVYALLKVRGKN